MPTQMQHGVTVSDDSANGPANRVSVNIDSRQLQEFLALCKTLRTEATITLHVRTADQDANASAVPGGRGDATSAPK